MENHNEHITNIILKYLNNELNSTELRTFENWLNESRTNYKYFMDIKSTWLLSKYKESDFNKDTDTAWQKISDKLELDKKETKIFTLKKQAPLFLKIAAALLIGVFFTIFYIYNQSVSIITVISENESKTIILPDSSLVHLNIGSQVSYPEKFNKNNRHVSLKGEAFFDVQKDKEKPFVISTDNSEIKVLGTSFCVKTSELGKTEVFVTSGKVELSSKEKVQKISLTKGEKAALEDHKNNIAKEKIINEDFMSWRKQNLEFINTKLEDVAIVLENIYKVKILFQDADIKSYKITSKFKNESIDNIIKSLNFAFNTDSEYINISNTYVIKKLN